MANKKNEVSRGKHATTLPSPLDDNTGDSKKNLKGLPEVEQDVSVSLELPEVSKTVKKAAEKKKADTSDDQTKPKKTKKQAVNETEDIKQANNKTDDLEEDADIEDVDVLAIDDLLEEDKPKKEKKAKKTKKSKKDKKADEAKVSDEDKEEESEESFDEDDNEEQEDDEAAEESEESDSDSFDLETLIPPKHSDAEIADKKKKRKKTFKILGIVFASIFGLVLVLYGIGFVVFLERFCPNTTMGDLDLSMKSRAEAEQIIDEKISQYTLKASGLGLDFSYSVEDISLNWDKQDIVENALHKKRPWKWVIDIFREHDVSDTLEVEYAQDKLSKTVTEAVATHNETATLPINATIAYSDENDAFQIVDEAFGTAIDSNSVITAIDNSIHLLQEELVLSETELVYPLVGADSEVVKNACSSANQILKSRLNLTLAETTVKELVPDDIAPWVVLKDDYSIDLNEELISLWVEDFADQCDTIGAERTYTRPDGKEVTVSGGSYGWEIDGDALRDLILANIRSGQAQTFAIPALQEGTGFGELGGRDWGNRYIDIDISEQYARFYDHDGSIIWEADVVTGKPYGGNSTPRGVWMINTKQSPSQLIGAPLPGEKEPEYRTWVKFWMPFVGNSIGLHDATWQAAFGGERYRNGYGSHGCVNLSYGKAESLYYLVEVGDVVISHD